MNIWDTDQLSGSLRKNLLILRINSRECFLCIYLTYFLLFSLLFSSQLFVRPPWTAILLFCHFFSMGMVLIPVSITMLEKTRESPLDCKEIQPVHSEGDQPWDFFGRNDAKAETPVIWPPHVKSWLIGKDSDAGRDWGQEEKGMTEDEMAGWHHWLDGRESEWTLGVGDGQGGLACCYSWGRKESDTTEQLIWSDLSILCILPGSISQS